MNLATYQPKGLIDRGKYTYSLKKLQELSKNIPSYPYKVQDLKWNLEYIAKGEDYDRRIKEASIKVQYPLLITKDINGQLDILDGLHRLQYAFNEGIEKLPGKLISHKILQKAKL